MKKKLSLILSVMLSLIILTGIFMSYACGDKPLEEKQTCNSLMTVYNKGQYGIYLNDSKTLTSSFAAGQFMGYYEHAKAKDCFTDVGRVIPIKITHQNGEVLYESNLAPQGATSYFTWDGFQLTVGR